ncbi:TetR/AcrR family transcriptional regulator [uncultured Williamsia sp.]|uniref:TetR/AcrR family transcriptional regulator n=1 Tax=uncultured Williamsia sp. TaxID=259311 RepID=UPI00262AA74E|nr:TetR/AcrR family transcriptional regulator [uncultured Williamsia sp.]
MSTSVIAQARRRQLVEAAIEVIDEVGVGAASLVQISRRAGVSRGVINYHVAGRAPLFEAVVEHVYALGREVVAPDTESAATATAAIAAMIHGSIAFYTRYPREMRVLSALFVSDDPDSPNRSGHREHADEIERVAAIVERGHAGGEFRAVDGRLAAAMLRAALDEALARITADVDTTGLGAEIEAAMRALLGADHL